MYPIIHVAISSSLIIAFKGSLYLHPSAQEHRGGSSSSKWTKDGSGCSRDVLSWSQGRMTLRIGPFAFRGAHFYHHCQCWVSYFSQASTDSTDPTPRYMEILKSPDGQLASRIRSTSGHQPLNSTQAAFQRDIRYKL